MSAAVDMLEWLEKLCPRLKKSDVYHKLSLRSTAEESSHGSVEAAVANLTEAKEKMKEEVAAHAEVAASVGAAVRALGEARHEMKGEARPGEEVIGAVGRAVGALALAEAQAKHEAELGVEVEDAVHAAVSALDAARKVLPPPLSLNRKLVSSSPLHPFSLCSFSLSLSALSFSSPFIPLISTLLAFHDASLILGSGVQRRGQRSTRGRRRSRGCSLAGAR